MYNNTGCFPFRGCQSFIIPGDSDIDFHYFKMSLIKDTVIKCSKVIFLLGTDGGLETYTKMSAIF